MDKKKQIDKVIDNLVSQQFDFFRRMTVAYFLLTKDVEGGFRTVAAAIAAIATTEKERTDEMERIAEEEISFLIGLADEVRHHVVRRLEMLDPVTATGANLDDMKARDSYENMLSVIPPLSKAMFGDGAAEKKDEMQVRVVKIEGGLGNALKQFLKELEKEKGGNA